MDSTASYEPTGSGRETGVGGSRSQDVWFLQKPSLREWVTLWFDGKCGREVRVPRSRLVVKTKLSVWMGGMVAQTMLI